MFTIPLKKQAFFREDEVKQQLAEFILHADQLSMGEQCSLFEQEFATWQGAQHALLFNSGGSANLAMIQALKNLGRLKTGDRVGFSALTWATNVMPIIQLGLEPVPVDIDPSTLNVMSRQLEETADLQALFITNALGFSGDLDSIQQQCRDRGILLIEDNCESLGSALPVGKCGSFGAMSSFSFYIAHHMSTIEGGMVCTDDAELAEMLKIVRANGWDRNLDEKGQEKWRSKAGVTSDFHARYTFYDLGYNLRPTEITGFLGRLQLRDLDGSIAIRSRNFALLNEASQANGDLLKLECEHMAAVSNFAFPIVTPHRQHYLDLFDKAGIETRPVISGSMQNQPFFSKYVKKSYSLPGAEQIDQEGFYVGNYPELTERDLSIMIECLGKIG